MQCKNLRAEIEVFQTAKSQFDSQIQLAESKSAELSDALATKNGEIEKLRENVAKLSSEHFDATTNLTNTETLFATRISEVEAARETAVIEKAALELSMRSLQQEKSDLQVQLNQLQSTSADQTSSFGHERQEFESKISILTVQKDKLEADVAASNGEFDRAQKDIETLHEKAMSSKLLNF